MAATMKLGESVKLGDSEHAVEFREGGACMFVRQWRDGEPGAIWERYTREAARAYYSDLARTGYSRRAP